MEEIERRFWNLSGWELIDWAKKEGQEVDHEYILMYGMQRWFVVNGWVQVGGDSAALTLIGVALQEKPMKLLWGQKRVSNITGSDVKIPIDEKSLAWDTTQDTRVYPAPLGSHGEWEIVPCEVDSLYVKYLLAVDKLTELAYEGPKGSFGTFMPIVRLLKLLYHYTTLEKEIKPL